MMKGTNKGQISLCALASCMLLTGCAAHQHERVEGVTFAAGDAIAANTVMQIDDPWSKNVRYTDIAVPANRRQYQQQPDQTSESQIGAGNGTSTDGVAY